jgi:hypothetical protein
MDRSASIGSSPMRWLVPEEAFFVMIMSAHGYELPFEACSQHDRISTQTGQSGVSTAVDPKADQRWHGLERLVVTHSRLDIGRKMGITYEIRGITGSG